MNLNILVKKALKPHIKDVLRYRKSAVAPRFLNALTFPIWLMYQISTLTSKAIHKIAREISGPAYFQLLFPRPNRARRYIAKAKHLEFTFKKLEAANINYSLLRWYEDLPRWPKNEDIDILIADEDLAKARPHFSYFPKRQAVDLYTESATSSWDGLPYYPPHLAKRILQSRVRFKTDFWIPDAKAKALSFLYHVLIHKGEKSGLPFQMNEPPLEKNPEHNYQHLIQSELANANLPPLKEVSLDAIFKYLKEYDWLPGLDTLRKRSQIRPVLTRFLPEPLSLDNGELIVFVFRKECEKERELIRQFFERRSFLFHIIEKIQLNPEQVQLAKTHIRGGEWGKGPFIKSGGDPAEMWIVFDYSPKLNPSAEHPFAHNENSRVKNALREEINRNRTWWNRVNPVHSSDDELEAYEYIQAVFGAPHLNKIKVTLEEIRNSYYGFSTQKRLDTIGSRARVDLVSFEDKKAIRKTFKESALRFFEREKWAATELSKKIPGIPKCLELGTRHIVYENIQEPQLDESKRRQQLINKKYEILEFLYGLWSLGYFSSDFHPGNILVGKDKLYFVDFEFLQKYDKKPEWFEDIYELKGVPRSFVGDRPRGHRGKGRTLESTWAGILSSEDVSNFTSTRS